MKRVIKNYSKNPPKHLKTGFFTCFKESLASPNMFNDVEWQKLDKSSETPKYLLQFRFFDGCICVLEAWKYSFPYIFRIWTGNASNSKTNNSAAGGTTNSADKLKWKKILWKMFKWFTVLLLKLSEPLVVIHRVYKSKSLI